MRVIKTGKQRVWEQECSRCNSLYEYNTGDYFEKTVESPSGLRREVYHFFKDTEVYREIVETKYKCLKCPVCGYVTKKLDFDNVFPKHVRWERV